MDKFTARRKILRGSLAAPVVMTVASPANLAAASTTCLVNTDQRNPPTAFLGKDVEDGYLRTEIEVCQFKVNGGGWTPDYYYNYQGKWYSWTTGNEYGGTPTTERNCAVKEALVYVDSAGQTKGYGWLSTSGGGSFTSMGCWHSLLIRP